MAEGGYAMEEKGVKDRKREPEEYNFDYEELADAEVIAYTPMLNPPLFSEGKSCSS